MKKLKLVNNNEIPIIGFGEFLVDKNDCVKITKNAINVGYTHFDTAQFYMNEEEVGTAIIESKIDRKKFFITTKIWFDNMGYEKAKKSLFESLGKLKLDYIDLVLIHQPYGDYYGAWRAMEEFYDQGKIKAIGVSNFSIERLADLYYHAKIKPMVNQIEISPLIPRKKEIEWCKKNNIVVEAWSPIGGQMRKDLILNNEKLKELSKQKNKSVVQIVLRWLVQQDVVTLIKSNSLERMKENIDVFDFELNDKEMQIIDSIELNQPLIEHTSLEGFELIKNIAEQGRKNENN